jgi:DNA-binding winged helix-turn-helix (wHTH) protein/tetratricopeptide (TPR) repeat protein
MVKGRQPSPREPFAEAPRKLLTFGPFGFDPSVGALARDGQLIELPPRALAVLGHLLERPGEIISKEILIDAVWNDTAVTERSLSEAVGILRQALDDDPHEPTYIQTVHRRGYRFMAPVSIEEGASLSELLNGPPDDHEVAEEVPSETSGRTRRRSILVVASVFLVVLIGVLGLMLYQKLVEPLEEPSSTKPAIAVLSFENISGDADLDWLRWGLPEMLVTGLSQSPHIDVIAARRVYAASKKVEKQGNGEEFDIAQRVGQESGANRIIEGSFARAGEEIRINLRLRDVENGKVLLSDAVEGTGDSNLFAMADKLIQRIRDQVERPRVTDTRLDRGVMDVTTSSIEAYRAYCEASNRVLNYNFSGQAQEVFALMHRAVELDPEFSLALAKLGNLYANSGDVKNRDAYRKRALEHAHRLTLRERYYVESSFYMSPEVDSARAIDIFQKALEDYPDDGSMRNNLATVYLRLERYEDAVEHFEENRRRGWRWNLGALAWAYMYLGDFERAHEVVQDRLQWQADYAGSHLLHGDYLMLQGKLNEALQAYEKATSLARRGTNLHGYFWQVYILKEHWDEAWSRAEAVTKSTWPLQESYGWERVALTQLFRGQSHQSLESLERALQVFEEPEPYGALVRNALAHVLMERGQVDEALEQARLAVKEGEGNTGEFEGLFCMGLAQVRSGQTTEALETAERLQQRAKQIPSEREFRRCHHLAGEMALTEGDADKAIVELAKAEALLPARGSGGGRFGPPQHVPIWFSLGRAYWEAGERPKAVHWFQRIVECGHERLYWPIFYVRSFYYLGKYHESRGEDPEALHYYQRFLDFWKDGDIDRNRVAEVTHAFQTLSKANSAT